MLLEIFFNETCSGFFHVISIFCSHSVSNNVKYGRNLS